MKHYFKPILVTGLIILLLTACSGPAAQPLHFNSAPWTDGEVSVYDVIGRDGTSLGTASWSWRRGAEGWIQGYELILSGRTDRGEVILGADLSSQHSWRELSGKRFETAYDTAAIIITTTAADGTTTTKTLKPPTDSVDNDVSLQIHRALPLAAGYFVRYTDVIPTSGALAPVTLKVTANETLTVPAGIFPAWRGELDFGSGKHDAWYGQDAPYPLLKYTNRGSGTSFLLRSLGQGQPTAAVAAAAPQQTAAPATAPILPPLNLPFILAAVLVQFPIMIIFPLALGWWIHRRYGIRWGIFGAGVLTFIASQVVHLPLNYALGLLGGGRGVALWPLPLLALVAGLSAGVCEEGARWLVLRFFLKQARGWRPALQFGAGHGGSEAIIFGLLALVNFVAMIALRSVNGAALGMPAEAASQIQAAQAAYWGSAWYLPIVGGVERLFAITIQIALTQVVMLAFTRKNIAYLAAAIGLHALVDTWAVWATPTLGVFALEAGVILLAAAALWLIWRLRDVAIVAEPRAPAAAALTAADLAPRTLSPEELARRADQSQYE